MFGKVLFTHDDLDGAGCRILFTLANGYIELGEQYLIVNCTNNNVDQLVIETLNRDDVDPKNTSIYFGDICASRKILEDIKNSGYFVQIYDHHRTNFFCTHIFENAVIIPENELGVPECGTSLMFKSYCSNELMAEQHGMIEEYFNTVLMEEFVETVRRWDTYQWKDLNDIHTRKFQILFTLLGMENFCKLYIQKLINASIGMNEKLIDDYSLMFVNAKLESENKIIENFTKDKVYDINIRGFHAAFALSKDGADISELGNQFLTRYPEYDMFISYSLFGNGAYGFRAVRNDIDIATDFAVHVGGGGHPKAAGSPIPVSVKDELTKVLLNHLDENWELICSPSK